MSTRMRVQICADKGYDSRGFVKACREMKVTPHVARSTSGSASHGRTTWHGGYTLPRSFFTPFTRSSRSAFT